MSSKNRVRSQDSCSSNWSNVSRDNEINGNHCSHKYDHQRDMNVEHELFLQAFEKPTQIYRYLRTRHLVSPIFLNRTLTYMKHRLSRNTNRRRKDFSVDSLLGYVIDKKQRQADDEESSGNLTLNILCANDQDSVHSSMTLETLLLKMCHKKRKDVSTPMMHYSVGKCEINVNKEESINNSITIYKSDLSENNGHQVKSYSLLFLASYASNSANIRLNVCEQNSDNRLINMCDNNDEQLIQSPACKKRKVQEVSSCYYKAELIIFDKHQRCLLTDGEYTVVLQPCAPPVTNKLQRQNKFSSWEALIPDKREDNVEDFNKQFGPMEVFRKGPVLRFHLAWSCLTISQNKFNNSLHSIKTFSQIMNTSNIENNSIVNNSCNGNNIADTSLKKISENCSSKHQLTDQMNCINNNNSQKKLMRVLYQFVFNNNTRQQTKPRNDFHCPWCSLNCKQLYSLLKHLKLCHNRFIFTHYVDSKCYRIDVAINDCYDGSYAGNPHDLSYSNTGFAFSRNGPVRRNPVTLVIVCRPKRFPHSLSEFDEQDDEEGPTGRTCISGHNRLYYHTNSCLPIRPQEMEYDSEAENDPQWMKEKTQLMIDEFTDVNEGEKEVMKMWNLHIMKNGFVGDCQIPLACSMFVEENGAEIIQKKLYKNFILHLCNLFDFGLLNASTLTEIVIRLDQKLQSNHENPFSKQIHSDYENCFNYL